MLCYNTFMEGKERRDEIFKIIAQSSDSVSATKLSKTLGVSRQVIVSDIALLRAQGAEIIATSRGYIVSPKIVTDSKHTYKVACIHSKDETKSELYLFVDLGAVVVNTIVEHEYYGEIVGCLNLISRQDVDYFIDKLNKSEIKLLSELTGGVHLHTIACSNKEHFDKVVKKLDESGFLFKE